MKLTFLAALATLIIPQTLPSADMFYARYSNTLSRTNVSLIGSLAGCAGSASISVPSLEKLVDAIAAVESGNNPTAIGDQGRARGAWQLHEGAVNHVNQLFHTSYVWPQDALNPTTARQIVKLYLIILGYTYPENVYTKQYFLNIEKCVRKYNGGYKHWNSAAASRYWQKIQRALRAN